ncbi:MAG: glycoside hydrolase family 57 protein [Bacteroidota bacterium]|nr:glycoside hydrolase family 57 protein [Candidatus Kapabacteria bacterium]MDW8270789.1 glycoside hydrolase family 57 protein [Bacteroidota bacterium]
MSASPLRVAILWHFHQPDYRIGEGVSSLPWVRLHATKDYAELPAIHRRFPRLRLTYNFTPILLEQLDEYRRGVLSDDHALLSLSDPMQMTDAERQSLLQWGFVGNATRLIEPFERYRQLRNSAAKGEYTKWQPQDWLDLQVWMRLAWLGETVRRVPPVAPMIEKGRFFSAEDRARLCALEQGLLLSVFERMRALVQHGIAEISCSPYYHPILPLLCSTDVVAQSDPDIELLQPSFAWSEDAREQVTRAIGSVQRYFETSIVGMWPSEGAISDEALAIIADSGIIWAASDQMVLRRSAPELPSSAWYQPFRWEQEGRKIVLLFRDPVLSDAIGFVYSSWEANAAARDFLERLHALREAIIEHEGEQFLSHAVVPVILDGENCWEYYERNGLPFLEALYEALTSDDTIETVTFSEVAQQAIAAAETPVLHHVVPGSWIGGSLRIWSGHAEDRMAWALLRDARHAFAERAQLLDEQARAGAYRHLLTAEGSDWFWWFGDEHRAAFRFVFDRLFRLHLEAAYRIMGIPVPTAVQQPIMQSDEDGTFSPFGAMHPATFPTQSRRDG